MRLGNQGPWIPIFYIVQIAKGDSLRSQDISMDSQNIRGYNASEQIVSVGNKNSFSLQVCDFGEDNSLNSIQLRWLQTSQFRGPSKDLWSIDDVQVTLIEPESGTNTVLLEDTFDESQLK